jgi:tetratricopeptide (TPR) repeat protein
MSRSTRWSLLGTAIAAAVALGGYAFSLSLRPARAAALSDTDTVVLAHFTNTTGDPVFDNTLRQGLSVQLQQSPFLSLVPDTRIRFALGLAGKPADTQLTPDVARDVCQRVNGKAVLDGSIAPLGTQYVIGLRAVTCATGDVLAEEQLQAARKEDVLDALGRVASVFRGRLGESLAMVTQYSTPVVEATTTSMEALKVYSDARRLALTTGTSNAIPGYLRAIELDPTFALVQAELGLAYSNVGETRKSIEHTKRAYEHRNRATEYERFKIEVLYARQVTGNLEKAREIFDQWMQVYPRDSIAQGLFAGFTSNGTGRHERGIEQAEKSIAIDPDGGFGYINLANAYFHLDRVDDARKALARAEARKISMNGFGEQLYWIAFFNGDRPAMAAAVAKDDAREDPASVHNQSLVAALWGNLPRARELSRRAVDIELRNKRIEGAATFAVAEAVWEAVWGRADAARARARYALGLETGRELQFGAALALALSGDVAATRPFADALAKNYPEHTSVQTNYLPVLKAFGSLAANEPSKALDALEANRPYERAAPFVSFMWNYGGRYPLYLRGLALSALGRHEDAVVEFRKLLNARGLLRADPLGALARVQLARTYAKARDVANARAAYQDFFQLTKDADAGLPLSVEARNEFARLK